MLQLYDARVDTRATILHVGAHAVSGPGGQLVRIKPTMFALLQYLLSLPPDTIARYHQVSAILWPGGDGQPYDEIGAIRWHICQLNKLAQQVGYYQVAEVIDRVGVRCRVRYI